MAYDNNITSEQINKYERLVSKSVRGHGAKTLKAKRTRKKTTKLKFKPKLKNLIVLASIVLIVYQAGIFVNSFIGRTKSMDEALDYMSVKIISYLEKAEVNYILNEDKSIIIVENDLEDLTELRVLMEEDGFDRDAVFYIIKELCGNDAFDKIVRTSGYEDSDDFLTKNYFSGPRSDSGETYFAKYPDEHKFENNVEQEVIETINSLKGKPSKNYNFMKGKK